MAPMGDLVESMFKRNLDVKDFGSIVKGHGGVLDRFDGFLFTLPAVYYLTIVLEPWTACPRRVATIARRVAHVSPIRVAIAGSTGSIGTQTLDVVRAEGPTAYEVVGARRRVVGRDAHRAGARSSGRGSSPSPMPARRAEVAAALAVRIEVVDDLADARRAGRRRGQRRRRLRRPAGHVATLPPGSGSALANKESLIAAGPVVQPLRATPGAELIPVDSEHCAVHQCLRASADAGREVARIVLTASGGPFRGRTADETGRRSRSTRRSPIRRGRWVRRSRSTRAR